MVAGGRSIELWRPEHRATAAGAQAAGAQSYGGRRTGRKYITVVVEVEPKVKVGQMLRC